MIRTRSIWILVAVAVAAVASGLLIGYPVEAGAAAVITYAAFVSLITTRDLADRAQLRRRRARRVAERLPLEQLRRVDETLAAAHASEVGRDRELRPLFRAIAATRLARRGVDLDRNPVQARAILGEDLWELVRSGRSQGSHLVAGGVSTTELQSLIGRLERI